MVCLRYIRKCAKDIPEPHWISSAENHGKQSAVDSRANVESKTNSGTLLGWKEHVNFWIYNQQNNLTMNLYKSLTVNIHPL